MKDLSDQFANKKSQVSDLLQRTNELRTRRHELEDNVSMAKQEMLKLEGEQHFKIQQRQKIVQKVRSLEHQINEIHEQNNRNTQAEHDEIEEKLMAIQVELNEDEAEEQRLKEEQETITQRINMIETEVGVISEKVKNADRIHREISSRVIDLKKQQRNKVTAFGGDVVINLLRVIERRQQAFSTPPIGPIGAHVKLKHGDWSVAVNNAVGQLLNAFIVTNHADSLILRECAREARYFRLRIIIYDFKRPRLNIPRHMLPQIDGHPTTLNVIDSDSPTVLNVLVDLGNAERQVLVKDYEVGKRVAFEQRISNLKEVYTSDGYKMFTRGSAQTILPPFNNSRGGGLCASFDDQIKNVQRQAEEAKVHLDQLREEKRKQEGDLRNLQDSLRPIKKKQMEVDRHIRRKTFELQDLKKSLSSEAASTSDSTVDELHQEISKLKDDIREKETSLEELKMRVDEARNRDKEVKASLKNFLDSAQKEVNTFNKAEEELMLLEKDLREAEAKKKHYEGLMNDKVLPDLKNAEAEYQELENLCKESHKKASVICPQSEVEDLGCKESNPEQLSADLTQLKQRFQRESQRFSESIEDLKMLREKKQLKISRKQQTYKTLRDKLEVCEDALQLRWGKYQKTALGLARQLTWQFSGHLRKKGIQGSIKVNYEDQTLSIEVTMPQDASSSTVKDTRGLSGGERSFSTLCFALTLHEMTESPFRAMDEFDVFMDAVSRKISLDAIVDFALGQGSQWIFITPHDISMVKNDERIKKQQMAAPRG